MSLNPFQDQQPHEETALDQSYLASMKKLISTIRVIDFNQQFRHHWQRRKLRHKARVVETWLARVQCW